MSKKAYWDLAAAVELVDIRNQMYEEAQRFYRINEKKKELGTSELTDLLAAEANMELRKSELEVEEDNLKVAINKLRLSINYPENDKDVLPISLMKLKEKKIVFIQSLKRAFENRRDYERAKEDIKAGSAVVEGEIVAIGDNRHPRPFQDLSRRIKRKYRIEEMVKVDMP